MAKIAMQKREKMVVLIGAVVVAVIVSQWLFSNRGPFRMYHQSIREVEAARLRLQDAQVVRDEALGRLQSNVALEAKLRSRGAFGLYSHVDRALQAQNLKGGQGARATLETQNTAVRSGAFEAVKLHLEGVSMEELLDLLLRIHSGENLIVLDRLDELRPADDGRGLVCDMVLVAPRG
ncbi:MAG TPA: hypothetical protein PLB67_13655 [Candidatus Hydrogenedentes bacterium]|jgi:hypothetical protein|nr:hypothetical protein [Candidatus Hydrogenedentota bacterium]MDY0032977.1 hypothetical protein [FCB group bacterium]NLT61166.1 hypothetical protein [Candidatus Hydrogenedentota bacterium]HNZ18107.1 hypothetical protein [Candidatus Hydrogenedentota bacterium]HOH32397.1 hypothetical protein [Candidatus Hydrogenedentota bacterium]